MTDDKCDFELYKWLANTAENLQLYCCSWSLIDTELLLDCKSKEEALDFIEGFINEPERK